MTVRLLTSRVLATGQTQDFGDVVDLPDAEARRLIDHEQAVAVGEPETAALKPVRNAMKPLSRVNERV